MAGRKAPSLRTPYSAYNHRNVPPEDSELTHVGPETPCGEYLRRFWHPVGLSQDLQGLPVRIRVLGEDLVLFRDGSGAVGLLELHCAHRGASLEFGIVSEHGIRCCYHGWLYGCDGKILDTPGEPPTSRFKDRLYHGAYPTLEYKGLIFAYLGPPERKPLFPLYDTFELPGFELRPMGGLGRPEREWPCNWLQIKENSMDPVHTAFLHTIVSGAQFSDAFGQVGQLDWQTTPIGMVYVNTRRVDENVWVRINDFVLPNVHQFGSVLEDGRTEGVTRGAWMCFWAVPVDDTHTLRFGYRLVPETARPSQPAFPPEAIGFGQSDDRPYEERQRRPGDYDAQVSQRPIAIHALEHLGASDRGVILLRKLIKEGIRAVQNGGAPVGLVPAAGDTVFSELIPTYTLDAVFRVAPAASEEADDKLLRQIGREVASGEYVGRAAALSAGGRAL